jgi:hypothetical protein
MVLVSILGDFDSSIIPVFYQMRNKITKHIVIYDDFKCDEKEANRIIEGLNRFKEKYNFQFEQISYKVDEDSQKSVILAIAFFHKHCDDFTKLYVNTTDGLSSFNTYLAFRLLPLGANIIAYDRYDNECNIVTKDGMSNYKVDAIISIQDHFLLKNLEIFSIGDKAFALQHKELIIKLFETKKLRERYKEFANYLQTSLTSNFGEFGDIAPYIKALGIEKEDLKSNLPLITGGLFEYYIFLKLVQLSYDDIEIGVTIRHFFDGTDFIPNEFDILIMKNNHLHMIECKYTNRVKLDQLVYKYMALKHLIDDDGKIIMLTSYDEFMPKIKGTNETAYMPHKRAKANRMLLLGNPLHNIDRFIEEVKNFLELEDSTK